MRAIRPHAPTVPLAIAALIYSLQAFGDEVPTSSSKAEWASAGTKFGSAFIKMLAGKSQPNFPPNEGSDAAQQQALKKVLQEYQTSKTRLENTSVGLKAVIQFGVDGTAMTMAGTGVGLVPAAIVKTAGQLAADYSYSKIDATISQSVGNLLAKRKDEILQLSGGDLNSLRGKSSEELKTGLEINSSVYRTMKAALPRDEGIQKMADELVITSLRNVTSESLSRLQSNSEDLGTVETQVASLATGLFAFEAHTTKVLQDHERAIKELNGAVSDISSAVNSINQRIRTEEHDQNIVANAVFQHMSADERTASLKNGFLSSQFACPAGASECPKSQLKAELIKKSAAEAKAQKIYAQLVSTAGAIGDVSMISKSFGIEIRGLDTAARYSNIAVSAFSAYSTGNYLAAAAAISGLFASSQPDPTMVYLQHAFAQVNRKLDDIERNQETLMVSVYELSKQMSAFQRDVDQRLGRIEFETKRVSASVANLAWVDWKPCLVVYDYVIANEKAFGFNRFGDFQRVDDMTSVFTALPDSVADCVKVAQSKPTLRGSQWFGSFLDISTLARLPQDAFALADGNDLTKSDLEKYEIRYLDARTVLVHMLARRQLPISYALLLLSHPSISANKSAARFSIPTKLPCGVDGFLEPSLEYLLCRSVSDDEGPDATAFKVLERPLTADGALAIGNWMLVASRFADFKKPREPGFYSPKELLGAAPGTSFSTAGREILNNMIRVVDVAVASQAIIYGDVMARAVADAVVAPFSPDQGLEADLKANAGAACRLLKKNPYLAHNVLMFTLHDRMRKQFGTQLSEEMLARRYGRALDLTFRRIDYLYTKYPIIADSIVKNHNLFAMLDFDLRDAFGPNMSFGYPLKDEKRQISVTNFNWGGRCDGPGLEVQMPTPEMFHDGLLNYPPQVDKLAQLRHRLVERVLDYDFFLPLTEQEKQRVAVALLRAR